MVVGYVDIVLFFCLFSLYRINTLVAVGFY